MTYARRYYASYYDEDSAERRELKFVSYHRAGSKANHHDAIIAYREKFGWDKPDPKIISTYRRSF